ncbi:YdbC family protein [Bacillus sp. 03113]|uniref:YdbC family protein n=1 Tax=Bacillus sp. 03113 TaxID=2578211 RepID=UPI00114239CB|nr:YdbC family protein [Bacillus sp. 03113]
MADIKYEIIETLGIISQSSKGWNKELNLISWNGNDPKYDLRDWSQDHTKMGKGITLTEQELVSLKKILNQIE